MCGDSEDLTTYSSSSFSTHISKEDKKSREKRDAQKKKVRFKFCAKL